MQTNDHKHRQLNNDDITLGQVSGLILALSVGFLAVCVGIRLSLPLTSHSTTAQPPLNDRGDLFDTCLTLKKYQS